MSIENIQIVTITPAIAAKLLEHNDGNRPIRGSRVAQFARAIAQNRWHVTNDAIAIGGPSLANPKRLMNGQHRLLACVEANQSIRVLLLTNVSDETFAVLDSGASRTVADVIGGTFRTEKAAVTAILLRHARNDLSVRGSSGNTRPMVDEIVKLFESEPLIAKSCEKDVHLLANISKARSGIVAAFVLARKSSPRKAEEFIGKVISGENLKDGDPCLTLRNRLITESVRGKSHRLPSATYFAMTLKCWNAFRAGTTLHRVGFKPGEAIPEIAPLNVS